MIIKAPPASPELSEKVTVRLFPSMKKKIKAIMAENPGRWENEAHFIRSATASFLAILEARK